MMKNIIRLMRMKPVERFLLKFIKKKKENNNLNKPRINNVSLNKSGITLQLIK